MNRFRPLSIHILIGFAALLVSGCSVPQAKWYKQNAGQADFNIDDAECRVIAEQLERLATLTRKKINIEAYGDTYTKCLFNKGWSTLRPGVDVNNKALPPIAKLENDGVSGFGRWVAIPDEFSLADNKTSMVQGVKTQAWIFNSSKGEVLKLIFQKAFQGRFKKTDFQPGNIFFNYDTGRALIKGDQLRWTVFSGNVTGAWIAGIGGYYLLDSKRRISIIITSEISDPESIPPEGLRIAGNQRHELDIFQEKWIGVLRSSVRVFKK